MGTKIVKPEVDVGIDVDGSTAVKAAPPLLFPTPTVTMPSFVGKEVKEDGGTEPEPYYENKMAGVLARKKASIMAKKHHISSHRK